MSPEAKGFIVLSVIKMLVVFTVVLVGVALLTLMERKVSAWMQDRFGPNRVGPGGLLQPVADGIKNIIKEETFPIMGNRILFLLAPALAFIPALLQSGVIPFAAPLPVDFDVTLPLLGRIAWHGPVPMVVADVPIGFLFVIAISSIGVYGIALAGWSSNSKYSLLGGLRAAAQLISYEVAVGLSLIPVLLLSGNVGFDSVIRDQQQGVWYVLPITLSWLLFFIGGFAETNRAPFDLPEAESELVAGYHSEYSAMKFSMFFIAEYANVATLSAMMATIYFGGWDIPFTHWDERGGVLQTLATLASFGVKTLSFIFVVMWVRWTLPRFRYDQLMSLGWKVLMPVALAYIVIITASIYGIEHLAGIASPIARSLILFGLNVALGYVCFVLVDKGVIIRGTRRDSARGIARPVAAIRPAAVP